jgi:hypothetical protein
METIQYFLLSLLTVADTLEKLALKHRQIKMVLQMEMHRAAVAELDKTQQVARLELMAIKAEMEVQHIHIHLLMVQAVAVALVALVETEHHLKVEMAVLA